jgi:hypothetical protein
LNILETIAKRLFSLLCLFIFLPFHFFAQNGASVFEWQRIQEIKSTLAADSVMGLSQFPGQRYEKHITAEQNPPKRSFISRKLFHEHLIQKEDTQFTFQFDPLFIFESGKDANDSLSSLYRNSRGVRISGSIGKNFQFQSAFLENQAIFPQHIRSFIAVREVSPGLGRTKIFKVNGSDFGLAWANFSWNMKPWLYISGGHGKNFIGTGYRSLLLSDNAFFYPYLKASVHQKKWSYTQQWSLLQDIYRGREIFNPLSEPLFVRKLFTWQYFTFNPTKNFEAGIYYSAIWTHSNASAIIPLPFVQHLQPYPSGTINPMAGLNLTYKFHQPILLYGQMMVDGSFSKRNGQNNSRMGWQLGGIWNQPFKLKGLNLQAEFNTVQPEAYAQANPGFEYHNGFFHYNQSLSHPLGANFSEIVGIVNYNVKRIFVSIKGVAYERPIQTGATASEADPLAENNFSSLPAAISPVIGNPLANYNTKAVIIDSKVGYVLNPSTRLKAYLGVLQRKAAGSPDVQYIYVGIGTSILNQYFDF